MAIPLLHLIVCYASFTLIFKQQLSGKGLLYLRRWEIVLKWMNVASIVFSTMRGKFLLRFHTHVSHWAFSFQPRSAEGLDRRQDDTWPCACICLFRAHPKVLGRSKSPTSVCRHDSYRRPVTRLSFSTHLLLNNKTHMISRRRLQSATRTS
jgi:hypothetical protein